MRPTTTEEAGRLDAEVAKLLLAPVNERVEKAFLLLEKGRAREAAVSGDVC